MGKIKKVAMETSKPSLSKVTKRKSIKASAGRTPKMKKLISLVKAKEEVLNKMLNFSEEEFAGSNNDTKVNETVNVVSPKHFVKPAESPIDFNQVKSGVTALFEYVRKTSEKKTELFDDEQPIFLQIASIKVPKTPNRQVRLTLKHSLLSESSEICLIVKDIGKAKDHDGTVEHYEELLQDKGITNIKSIMPYHQFKTEYGNQYELVRNLLGLYDYFLVDGSVSGYVTHRLGKIFLEKRKMPTSVKMNATNLKEHFESCLRKTLMKLHAKSDYYIVQVGHTKMSEKDVFENVCEIIDELDCEFPGGLDNVRSFGLKTDKSITIPVYLTLKNKSTVKVPVVLAKRPKLFKNVTGELTTFLDKDVTVLPTGEIVVTDQGLEDEEFSLESDNDEIMEYDFEDEEGEAEDGGDNDEEGETGNFEEEGKMTEEVQEKPLQDDAEEEQGEGILDEAEELYLNQYEQEQTNTRNTRKRNKTKSQNEEVPVKKGKELIKEEKGKKPKKAAPSKEPKANKQKKGSLKEIKNKNNKK